MHVSRWLLGEVQKTSRRISALRRSARRQEGLCNAREQRPSLSDISRAICCDLSAARRSSLVVVITRGRRSPLNKTQAVAPRTADSCRVASRRVALRHGSLLAPFR